VSKAQEYNEIMEKGRVLTEYNKRKKEEDHQMKNYLHNTYRSSMDESLQKRQEAIAKEKSEDNERLMKLKLHNEEEEIIKKIERDKNI